MFIVPRLTYPSMFVDKDKSCARLSLLNKSAEIRIIMVLKRFMVSVLISVESLIDDDTVLGIKAS